MPTVAVGAGAAVAHWLALRHGAAHPAGGSPGFWVAFFAPCVFSMWLSIEQVWHRSTTGLGAQWVMRQLVLVPVLIVLTAVFGAFAVRGAAQTGYATSPQDYSGPTDWLIDNVVLGALVNLGFGLLVSIAGLLLVLLPAGVVRDRREMQVTYPNVTAAELASATIGGFVYIAVLVLVFVVPTLLVVARDQSGVTQVVLTVTGISLGVVGLAAAFVTRAQKRSVPFRDG